MTTIFEQMMPYKDEGIQAGRGWEPSTEGRSADVARGIVLRGPWEAYADGFAEHTRRNARALAMAGAPVNLRSVTPRMRTMNEEDRKIEDEFDDVLRRTVGIIAAQIHQLVPHDGSLLKFVTHPYYSVQEMASVNAVSAFYCVWERTQGLREDDKRALDLIGQVWVGCRASRDFLCSQGIDESKIRVFGCPYLPGDPHLKLRGRARANSRPRFYHIGKWEPRKDQHRLVGAFLCAFRPGEAMLFVKTSERAPFVRDFPISIGASTQQWLADDRVRAMGWTEQNIGRDVIVATKRISDAALVSLHERSDCYVSLSHGEGFDMPAFDAKLSGNLMLYTPSGGPQDFAHDNDIRVEPSGTIDAHSYYNWAEGSKYIDWEFDAAVDGFRRAAKAVAERVPCDSDLSAFSALEVGKGMLASLNELGQLDLSQVNS